MRLAFADDQLDAVLDFALEAVFERRKLAAKLLQRNSGADQLAAARSANTRLLDPKEAGYLVFRSPRIHRERRVAHRPHPALKPIHM